MVEVEVDNDLKLLPASILDMYKVFEHIDMLSIGIWWQPYTAIWYQPSKVNPILLVSDFGALGHLWSQNGVITSWLRLAATSNCFPHSSYTYTNSVSILICCP